MKIRLNSITYTMLVAAFFASMQNIAFWERLAAIFHTMPNASFGFKLSLPFMMFAIMNVLFTLLIWPLIHRIVVPFLIVASAGATYAMTQYGVVFNYGMIVSVIETDIGEATSYLSWSVCFWFFALAVVPLLLVSQSKIRFYSLGRELLLKTVNIIASLLIVTCVASLYFKDYASLFRNHKELASAINPTNYITATVRVANNRLYEANQPFLQIGLDAQNSNLTNSRKNLMVLVIGETARAENSAFNGYEKETNAFLAKQDGVINYPNVTSCGTCTAVSVPCMFSNMSKANYSASQARNQEGLLDILQHAGVNVLWKNNNSGCKGACDRVTYIDARDTNNKRYCQWGSCYDGILLEGLEQHISSLKEDAVIVLHLLGSHGPTYYKRYPEEFKRFTPTCDTADIQNCSREALMNTYDNSLLYTDYLLSEVIDILQQHENNFNTSMLYVSDHGESLGENGVYLHGLPAAIAPESQTHVPMVTWLSKHTLVKHGLEQRCLKQAAQQPISHDNFFHSVLGLMDITTSEYQPELDIFSSCTTQQHKATQ
ncbi:phosphoethanolamine transferase EptA [Vibrio panuliri]|uniref:Phosphoethanolamine transferase EptA n=1 Tax=Vibrio panuliri TaxID=1381081 RepID=A0ABX3F8A5_9VIBR|nr:phosphoethanolamine transferase EptA [Vibrio panuliri]KAB1459624.1 phosphoethanolamine transferase EptA [Vibrio panuliri]OLQ84775.1 phosphoethanolamine transferase EptA [Vibrio panuliri]